MSTEKTNLRETYRHSSDSVKLALDLLGPQVASEPPRIPSEGDLATIARLMHEVVQAHRKEPNNDYRDLLLSVAAWIGSAADHAFLTEHLAVKPHCAFVLRKGLEVVHMILHRDLRRRSLTNAESQIYYDFVRLTAAMPVPPKKNRIRSVQGQS
jgi:hypothetical protein